MPLAGCVAKTELAPITDLIVQTGNWA
eukprot:COSAG06_NODE_4648_length_4068_cov_2.547493_1_plen_26_part_10